MNDQEKTKQQLIDELSEMRGKMSALRAQLALLEGKAVSPQANGKVLQSLYENAPLPYQSLDENGRFLDVNPAWLEMLGYSREEVIGKWFGDFLAPREVERFRNRSSHFKAVGRARGTEYEMIHKDGSVISVWLDATISRDKEEKFARTHCILQDITERKRSERILSEAREGWVRTFDAIPDLLAIIDTNHRIIQGNRAMAEQLGLPKEQLCGQPCFRLVHGTQSPPAFCPHAQMVLDEKDHGVDVYEERLGGFFHVTASPLLDSEGKLTGSVHVARNINERKKAEQALSETEARYRVLFNDSKDSVYITKRDGELIEANQAFFDLFGYTREEAIGGDIRTIYVNPSDRDRFMEEIETRGFLRDYPLMFRRKDGKEMECLLTSSLRRAGDGTILGYHGIIRDVTEQKNLQRQLLQAQKMEAIGTLAGGIAHDFNNLLQVTLGFSELLLAEKDENHPDYADLKKIFHAAQSGAELIHRLLMFSRRSKPKPVPMNLNKQILQVEKLLRRAIPKMIDIRLDLSSDLPKINADLSQIEQVLMNLAVNARDAMADAGKLTVKTSVVTLDQEYCRLRVDANPGEYVLLEVSDTGSGMDKETVEHIFEPFFTTKQIRGGTGLGLAMVYGIVNQHNGHITVYSEVGKGTIFRVYLPAMLAEAEPEVYASGEMPAFGSETILLADDEKFVRELGARILTKHGYTVLQAQDGKKAVKLFKRERSRISLVILDLIMPRIGGKDCLKQLLEIDPQVNVLVASGFSADASVKEMIRMGAKGFVTKPFRVKELLRDVRKMLDKEQ